MKAIFYTEVKIIFTFPSNGDRPRPPLLYHHHRNIDPLHLFSFSFPYNLLC